MKVKEQLKKRQEEIMFDLKYKKRVRQWKNTVESRVYLHLTNYKKKAII